MDFLSKLLDTSDFPQRWFCGSWTEFHGWLHICSDLAVFGAYTAIPIVIFMFVIRRKDVQFPNLFWLFCAFIFACGTVHLVEAIIFWVPVYRLSAVFKLITAIVSWATVLALFRVMPVAVKLPTLTSLNSKLEKETIALRETESKLSTALQKLQEAKNLTDAIIESISSGVVVSNNQGEVVVANAAAKAITGLDVMKADRAAWTQDHGTFYEDGETMYEEKDLPLFRATRGEEVLGTELLLRNGEKDIRVWLRMDARPVLDPNGKPLGGVAVFTDVTEARERRERLLEIQAETDVALDQSNRRLSRVVGSISEVVWSGESDENGFQFVYFSPAVEQLTGVPANELLDSLDKWIAMIHEDDRHRIADRIKFILKGEIDSTVEEYRLIHRDGTIRWIRNHVRLEFEGDKLQVFGVISNITREKKTNEVLVQAERLASLGTLSAGIAHEINNPLGAMMLTTELALKQLGSERFSNKDVQNTMEQIIDQIERCSKIVNNTLKFAKNEKSRKGMHSLPAIAMKAKDTIHFKAREKKVTISIEESGGEMDVEVNPTEIEQVIVNLLSNAIDASPAESEVKLLIESDGKEVFVAVHDDGAGLDMTSRQRAFDPFFTLKQGSGGTGLGLSMCHTIVTEHGGRIEINDSRVKKGANVSFQLPRKQVRSRSKTEGNAGE